MAQRLSLFAILCFACQAVLTVTATANDDETFFESQIRPALAEHCIKCHGPAKQSGGLRLDSADGILRGGDSGSAIVNGDAKSSLLIQAIGYEGDVQMPPKGKLPAATINALTHWVQAGAKWPQQAAMIKSTGKDAAADHWAFQPVVRPLIPDIAPSTGQVENVFLQNPIDHFVAKRLIDAGLSHSSEADRRTQIRRLAFSLTGLPPTPDEVTAFVNDTEPDAYKTLVDRLLDSPAHGEHWARHWLDVARYSDTKGYVYAREERFWVHAWAYRDWIVKAFNSDMPFDRFLLLQIAADQVPDRTDDDLAAMGFLTLGRRFLGVQREIYDDRIDVVTRGTMSLTVGCARCHDHKYDPIPTADYYSLYGVFASSRERILPLPTHRPPDEAFQKELKTRLEKLHSTQQQHRMTTSERLRSRIGDYLRAQFELEKYPEEGFDQIIATTDLLPSFVRRWQDFLAHAKRDKHPVFTAWHAFLQSAEPNSEVQRVSAFGLPQNTNALVAAAFATPPGSRDEMIQRYAALFADVEAQWGAAQQAATESNDNAPTSLPDAAAEEIRQVLYGVGSPCVVPDEPVVHTEYDFDSGVCTELWKLQGEVDRLVINAAVPQPFAVVLEDRAIPTTPRIFKRGNPAQKGDEVPRQFLKLLSKTDRQPFQHGSGRYELAEAIIDPQNPLTARVIVNRVWAHHFGIGMVSTPGDFGTRADPPSHPELLDWLADWFISEGWSLKKLHRLIVTSGVYRQASTGPADEARLTDAIRIDPGNRLLWGMNIHRLSFEEMRDSMLAASGQLDRSIGGKPADLFAAPFPVRRTLYGLIDRQFLPGTLRMFDFANPDLHIPQRSDTTVPQQALFLMNHASSLQQARALAKRVTDSSSGDDSQTAVVLSSYQQVLQRSPSAQQLSNAVAFLKSANNTESDDAPPLTAADWSYGFGKYDDATNRIPEFTPLPHFTGTAWQGGPAWPDATLGWVQLTATGGHPGNDRDHASIRRWTAPRAMTIQITSQVIHEADPGDGIRTFVVSSLHGPLQSANLHKKTIDLNVESVEVSAGETIDFVCDIGDVLNSDQHFWRIKIIETSAVAGKNQAPVTWNSESDFTHNTTQHLTPLEQLAQVLLCSNEFLFVD